MARKNKTADQRRHLGDVAALGCIACRNAGYGESPAEVHHITSGYGTGQERNDYDVIPLCPNHHRQGEDAVHVSPARFTAQHGHELDLLEQTRRELAVYRSSFVGGLL
ncbi:Ref family recombination enhancement nuclease [Kistimonas asteriae]|uniref:Ref family recombination enhancement nuclease n=1 Tax=Kistimonas asteriae TaxID=517724 RepID=UPI001BAC151D|nr:Ref family recombination enhancement nuclease [Kistimonas asteriae]